MRAAVVRRGVLFLVRKQGPMRRPEAAAARRSGIGEHAAPLEAWGRTGQTRRVALAVCGRV